MVAFGLRAAQAARAAAMRGERPPAPAGTGLADAQKSLGEALGTATQWKAAEFDRANCKGPTNIGRVHVQVVTDTDEEETLPGLWNSEVRRIDDL
jgi:hypothetical protein